MNVKSIEMTPQEKGRLKDLLDHPDFALLLTAISAKEAELQVEAGSAVTEAMVYGSNPPQSLPVDVQGKAIAALRWRSARLVLTEMASPKFWPAKEVRLTTEG